MTGLVCGRCGLRTAPNSTFCPRCRWALVSSKASLFAVMRRADNNATGFTLDAVGNSASTIEAAVSVPEPPTGAGGMIARRRVDKQRGVLERDIKNLVEPRIEALEKTLEEQPSDIPTVEELGTIYFLGGQYDRAVAYLQSAHENNPGNLETAINLGIALAQRGQVQPSLTLLGAMRDQHPDDPLVLLNLALVALQARRAPLALELADALEQLWRNTPALSSQYHDDTMTVRGLALLMSGKPEEARAVLQIAARQAIPSTNASSRGSNGSSAGTPANRPAVGVAVGTGATMAALVSEEGMLAPEFSVLQDVRENASSADEVGAIEGSGNADALNNLAVAEAEMGALDQAQKHLNAAINIEPGNTRVTGNLGVLAYQRGELGFALRMLELTRHIEHQAGQSEASTHNHLGVVYSALGLNEEAWREFGLASGHERADFEVWFNVGRAYIESGAPDKGMSFLRRAFALEPQNPDLHAALGAGYLLRRSGKNELLEEANKHLRRALQLAPQSLPALLGLAMTCAQSDNAQNALVVINQAQKMYPRRVEVLFLRSLFTLILETDAEHTARAGTQFSTVYAAQPELLAADYNASLCQFLMGLQKSAFHQLESVVARDPSFTPAFFLIGIGHATAGNYDQAIAAWKVVVSHNSEHVDAHANMGFAYYQKSEWQNAIAAFTRANRLAPLDHDILSCLGLSYGRAGGALRQARIDRAAKVTLMKPGAAAQARDAKEGHEMEDFLKHAVAAFQNSLKLKPNVPITYSNLGLSYFLLNHIDQAVEQWRTVSRIDARYALMREDEQYNQFDDSQMTLRPLRWREQIVGMMPLLPPPHTRLVPGYNERAFRPALSDPKLQRLHTLRRQLLHIARQQAWMNIKH